MVSSDGSVDHKASSDEAQQRASPHGDVTLSEQGICDTEIHLSKPEGARSTLSIVAGNAGKDSDSTACALQSGQEGSPSPLEKHLHSPDTSLHESQSGQHSPAIVREKVTKDGYNWRKYGQKHVKGNEFIRSYYKCTHPSCQAKKQLQQLNNGQITDSICIGQHNHPRPQLDTAQPVHSVLPVAEQGPQKPSLTNVEDKSSVEHGCQPLEVKPLHSLPASKVSPADDLKATHLQLKVKDEVHSNEDSASKRLKKENDNAAAAGVDLPTRGPRVVHTSSEVDFVDDGYRWRKYGQKLVRGNTNPRSYYRCSNPGCFAKKHVERASHDSKIVITTYEGHHCHEIPSARSVTTHNSAIDTHTMATNGKSGTKYEGSIVRVDSGSKSRLDEQQNEEPITSKSKVGDTVEFCAVSLSNEGHETKLKEQEQQNDDSGAKDDSVSSDIICHSSSEGPCRTNEQLKDEVKTTSEGSKDCLNVVAVDVHKQQPKSDPEPVQS